MPLTDKKDILTRCIYGVDIDVHAVEVSKFSLLIKLIEDETPASVKECVPILPDLSSNMKKMGKFLDFAEKTYLEKICQ